jgi:hypothetical protein
MHTKTKPTPKRRVSPHPRPRRPVGYRPHPLGLPVLISAANLPVGRLPGTHGVVCTPKE